MYIVISFIGFASCIYFIIFSLFLFNVQKKIKRTKVKNVYGSGTAHIKPNNGIVVIDTLSLNYKQHQRYHNSGELSQL